ncbi:MAG: protoheme IX farnesyltransferase [Oligoflexia bacterium]|nr:protoheme IX farnesyltransferase [Oligoflexia bacterium]
MKSSVFSAYCALSKSGIVTLVLISVVGGYLVGHPLEAPLELSRLGLTLFGVLCLASGSSAWNQLQEREIDALMPRTARRPLPSGRITPRAAGIFIAFTLLAGGMALLRVDLKVAVLGFLAVILYNGLYTLWWKKRWAYAAVPGAIPGALPALMGSIAANGDLWNPGGIFVFCVLFYWQMPHFWVLALRFREDYRKGNFPTLPVARGEGVTLSQITLWSLGYVGLALLAPLFLNRSGLIYLLVAVPFSLKLLWELRAFLRASVSAAAWGPVAALAAAPAGNSKAWLRFFLWINFSLIFLIAAAALDVWSAFLLAPAWV